MDDSNDDRRTDGSTLTKAISGITETSESLQPVPIPSKSLHNGPMTSNVTLPPRPRPGRKPTKDPEEALDRRRLQNRLAQRNFRENRQQKVKDLQEDLAQLYQEHRTQIGQYEIRIQTQQDEISRLQQLARQQDVELESLRAAMQTANLRIKSFEQSQMTDPTPAGSRTSAVPSLTTTAVSLLHAPKHNHTPIRSEPTPPAESYQELDFTNFFGDRTSRTETVRLGRHSLHQQTGAKPHDQDDIENCGFCTDSGNCLCRSPNADSGIASTHIDSASPESPAIHNLGAAQQQSTSKPAPGNCDACRADPERANACRSFYNLVTAGRTPGQNEDVTMVSRLPGPDSMLAPRDRLTSCSGIVDRVRQSESRHRLASIAELFGDSVRIYPSTDGTGYQMREAEAAEVLSALASRRTRR